MDNKVLCNVDFFNNPVNIIISYNSYAEFLVWAPPVLGMVMNIRFKLSDFGFIRQVHCV